jgi:nitroreductase
LRELVDLARLSPSGANRQPLKFFLSADEATNAKVFPHTLWAGYLKDWPGPGKGERPTAYIVILCDKTISDTPGVDHGIAAQSIMLGAAERGLGGCIIGSIHREKLREALGLAEHLDILLVLALGKPVERVVIAQPGADGDIRYWRDEEHVHHVPKRSLDELIINP